MTRNPVALTLLSAALLVTSCTAAVRESPPDLRDSDGTLTSIRRSEGTDTLYVPTQQCAIFDPARDQWDTGNGISTTSLAPEIHAGLMRFTDDAQNPVAHDLSESYVVSPDDMSYRFTPKPDLRFSDGSPVTAQDFKASWEHALRIGRARGYALQMLGEIIGAQAVLHETTSELSGVTVVDETTLEIKLAAANAHFEMFMAHPVSFLVKPDQAQFWAEIWPDSFNELGAHFPTVQLTPDQLPVGDGPFKLSAYQAGSGSSRCVLSRNEQYHDAPSMLNHVVLTVDLHQVVPIGSADGTFNNLNYAFESAFYNL